MSNEREFNLVVKHNDLIQNAIFDLSVLQQKILIYLISKIMPGASEIDNIVFSISEFCRCVGIDYKNGANYIYIRDVLHELSDINIKVKENGVYKNKRIIDTYELPEGVGIGTVNLHHTMKPYLLNLKNNFTKYQLFYILDFKSKYSIRLYELFKSNEYKRNFKIDIDLLQKSLGCNYSKTADFNRFVLKAAIKEINKKTEINVSYEFIKVGRAYKGITFNIKGWSEKSGQQAEEQLQLNF